MAKKPVAINFEESLAELEKLVQQLEAGELSLSESLSAFEQGVNLSKACQNLLDKAELKIQELDNDVNE